MEITTPTLFQFQKSAQTADTTNETQFARAIENKSKLSSLSAQKKLIPSEDKRLETACKDFEAILLNTIMSSMRKSIPEGGLFEKSYGEEVFQSMLDEQMTKEMAHGKGMGLAKLLYQDLKAPELSHAGRKQS